MNDLIPESWIELLRHLTIDLRDLIIQSPKVIQISDDKQPARKKINNPGQPLAHIKPVNAEQPQKCEQDPSNCIIELACQESTICLPVQRRNEK